MVLFTCKRCLVEYFRIMVNTLFLDLNSVHVVNCILFFQCSSKNVSVLLQRYLKLVVVCIKLVSKVRQCVYVYALWRCIW